MGVKKIKASGSMRAKIIDAIMTDEREITVGHACFAIGAALVSLESTDVFEPIRSKLTYVEYNKFMNEVIISIIGSVFASSFESEKQANEALESLLEAKGADA